MSDDQKPRIFISYSWTNPTHEDWVIGLAERLVGDGVDVVLDKWDLKEGHDKYSFMEAMVTSNKIVKVLMILDKRYAEKADGKLGGVGTESQIISPEVYGNVSQEKFIPIVAERDQEGNAYLPAFLRSRMYIDLSNSEDFEKNYEQLLRNIYKRPAFTKPKIGTAPIYLFAESPMTHQTTTIVRAFDDRIAKNPKRINALIREFLDKFLGNLPEYTARFSVIRDNEIGKEICDNINSYTPLRDDFITFFDKVTKEDEPFDIDILIRFLEELPRFKSPLEKRGGWSGYEFDNFRFIIHELFLYLIAVSIRNEKYWIGEELLYSNYVFKGDIVNNNDFQEFYNYVDSINSYYNKLYSQNYLSPMADLMVKRIPESVRLDNFAQADLLCHYVAELNSKKWFPITYIYKTRGPFDLFTRLQSKRHFEKTKGLYAVTNVDELKSKLMDYQKNERHPGSMRYSNAYESAMPIYRAIQIDKIGRAR